MELEQTLITVLIVIASILIFLVLREFWAWYFKTNELLKDNKKIIELLKIIANEDVEKPVTIDPENEGKLKVRNNNTGEIQYLTQQEWDKFKSSPIIYPLSSYKLII